MNRKERRLLEGKCKLCEEPLATSKLCRSHANKASAAQKKLIKKRKQNGSCISCGSSMSGQRAATICNSCADKLKDYARINKETRKNKGLCRQCDTPLSNKSKVFCDEHLKTHNEQTKKRLSKRPCRDCGKERDISNSSWCSSCKESRKIDQEARCNKCKVIRLPTDPKKYCRKHADEVNEKARKRRKKLATDGTCIFCYGDKEPERVSSSICQSCRDKQAERER